MNDDGLPRLPSLPWIRRIHDGYEQKKKEERHSFSKDGLFVYNSGGVKRNYNPPLINVIVYYFRHCKVSLLSSSTVQAGCKVVV